MVSMPSLYIKKKIEFFSYFIFRILCSHNEKQEKYFKSKRL